MATECEEHAWASIGVTVQDAVVTRVWLCENCRAWTRERFDEEKEVAWDETVLANR